MRLDTTLAVPDSRFVLVHYHIFKNGGTTIESILEREFPRGFATLHGESPAALLDAGDLASFLRNHPDVAAVSSHHLRYPKPAIRNTVVFDCCFLRHPLDRLESLYRYLRKIKSDDPLSCRAHRLSVKDFLRELVNESPHIVSNIQVTQLACASAFTRPANGEDLDQASTILREMAVPGLMDMYDESLAAAEYFLRPAFPALALEYIPQNISRPPQVGVSHPQSRETQLVGLWGAELYEDLARLNQLDLELFRRAENEIRRRIALVPEFDRRLKEFKMRCSRLEEPRSRGDSGCVAGGVDEIDAAVRLSVS
jgi:Sulfotransferase family